MGSRWYRNSVFISLAQSLSHNTMTYNNEFDLGLEDQEWLWGCGADWVSAGPGQMVNDTHGTARVSGALAVVRAHRGEWVRR